MLIEKKNEKFWLLFCHLWWGFSSAHLPVCAWHDSEEKLVKVPMVREGVRNLKLLYFLSHCRPASL